MYNFTKGKRLFVTGHRENDDPDNVGGGNGHHDLVNDSRTQREHHELNSKNHMASASQESREVFRQNNNRNGLKTVHTTRSVKKTTMVNKGEQKALPTYSMLEQDKLKERLLRWARKSTKGYPGVNVTDLLQSWRDGLALNAIIHRNRPDLVDYHKCREMTARDNHLNAFNILEKNFGVQQTISPDALARGDVTEDEMVKYLAEVYEVFPNPPEHNPLWDADKIRRIDEYKDLASRLVVWLRESIPKLKDRNFPNTLHEMKVLKNENHLFRTEQIPPKQHDKQVLAASYEDVVKMAMSLPGKHVKIEEDYNIANIEHLWTKMITAHQERDHAINEELRRLEKLERIADDLMKQIDICDNNLDNLKKRISIEEQRVLKQNPLEHNYEIDNIQRDIQVESDRIADMYETLKYLADRKYHDVKRLANLVDHLSKKLHSLKTLFENNVVKVLNDRREEALRKPKTEEELIRENPDFRFLHECIQWVAEKRKFLEGLSFGEDVHSIQRRSEQFADELRLIQNFQSSIDKCQSRKSAIEPEHLPIYQNMLGRLLTSYDELVMFTNKRIADLKSLLDFAKAAEKELAWIATKEEREIARDWSLKNLNLEEIAKEQYKLVKEIEARERDFNAVQSKGEQLVRSQHPCTKLIERLMARMQYNWSWLLQLVHCLEEHLRSTGDYYNFMDSVTEYRKAINMIEDRLNNQFSRQHFLVEEGEKMLQEMNTIKSEIATLNSKMSELDARKDTIVNLKQRKATLPRPIKVKSLCMIKNEQCNINKNEMVTLHDNSQRTKWHIRAGNNVDTSIPSVCFDIPPPDPDILDAWAELRAKLDALIALWAQKNRDLRLNQIMATMKLIKDWDYPTYCTMDPKKVDGILRMLEDDIHKLAREGPPDDPKIKRLLDELADIKKKLADFEARKRREEAEKHNQAMIAKFLEAANDLLEKLQEKERLLIQRAQNPIPRERKVLEQLVSEHREFEEDLRKYEVRIRQTKEEYSKIVSKSHAAESKYEAIIETWDRVNTLSKHYSERLTALEVVLADIESATNVLAKVQSKLVAHDEIPADDLDLNRMLGELVEAGQNIQASTQLFEHLLSNVTKVRRCVERTRPKQTTHSDLNRLEEDVKTLYKKWKNAAAHIQERMSGLELCRDLLRKYKTLMDSEKSWLNQMTAKVKTMNNRSELDYVTKIYENIVERQSSIDATNNAGTRFIHEARVVNTKIKTYRTSVEDQAEASAKRARKFAGVEVVEQELQHLNTEYKALLDKVLSLLNQLQDDESRLREFSKGKRSISKFRNATGEEEDQNDDDPLQQLVQCSPAVLKKLLASVNSRNLTQNVEMLLRLLGQGHRLDVNLLGQVFDHLMKHLRIRHIPMGQLMLTLPQSEAKRRAALREAAIAKHTFGKLSHVFKGRKKMSKLMVKKRSDAAVGRLMRQMAQGGAGRMLIGLDVNQLLGTVRLGVFFHRPNVRNCFTSILLHMGRGQMDQHLLASMLNPDGSLRADALQLLEGDPRLRTLLANALRRQFHENSIADRLMSWLDQKEKLISVLGPIGSEPQMVNHQLKQIHVMKDEFSREEHQLAKLDKLGNSILERIDRTSPQAKEVASKMGDIHKSWSRLLLVLDEREKNLLAVNEAAGVFQNLLNKLHSNLDGITDDFERICNSGSDPDEQLLKITNLEENLESQRPLLAEAGNACNNLCNLLTDAASKNEIREKFRAVEQKYNDLAKRIANKKVELQSTLKEDREFFMSCDQLQEWLRNMLNLLSNEVKISAILKVIIKQMADFEPIYREVMNKEHEVHMVLNRGNAILNKSSYRNDAANWRQTLDNIQRQWELVKKEAIEKNGKLHKCHDLARKYDQQYNELVPHLKQIEGRLHSMKEVPMHRQDLERQLREIQSIKNDLGKCHQDFDALRNTADQLLSVADTDKEYVKDQMNQLKELWDKLNAEVLKRHQEIESILHKLNLYREALRDFLHHLQRIEDRLHSHEAYADPKGLDRMRGLLDEAKGLRHQLDTVKNYANDLLADIKHDTASSGHIKAEVKDAEDRYNALLAKLEERYKNLDMIANSIKAFNLKLADIQNELNRLEERLNNMEPIARNVATLQAQLDEIKDFRSELEKVQRKLKEAEKDLQNMLAQDYTADGRVNKYQLDNLNRQYARIDENSNQRMKNILDMLDKLKNFNNDLSNVDKGLSEAAREIDRLKPISRDVDTIRAQQNEFKNFVANQIDPLARQVNDLVRKGDALIQSAAPGVDTSKLENDIEGLNNKMNSLKDKINDRNHKLNQAMMQAGRFQDALDAFERWLKETEDMIANQKPPSSDYKILKAQIQEQQFIKKMIHDREGNLNSLVDMGKELMKTLDSNEKYQIESQLNDLGRRFENVKVSANNRMALLEQILPVAKAFIDKIVPLQEWLDYAERKLNMLKHSGPLDQESIRQKLLEHKNLHQDILGHKGDFEELTEIAQHLMSLLTDDEAQIVVDKFKDATDRYAKLVEDSLNFGDMLNNSADILNNFILNFEDLFKWIDKMDARVNKHRLAAVTVDKIKDQLEDLEEINREIQMTENRVYDVIQLGANFVRTSSGSDSQFIKQKSEQLQSRFNELQRKAAEYLNNMREVLPIAQKFYQAHDKLNAWCDIAERSLKNLESQSLKQQESTIHTLQNQIGENKAFLEAINTLSPQFSAYSPGQGTATIEGIVIKDNRRFNSICDQINRQMEKIDDWKQRNDEIANDIDELYEWFKDAERQLLEAEGISYEPKRLIAQLKETKALHDDINSQKGRVREVLMNVKKFIRNANTEESIKIREKSELLKDLANHVSQLCSDRLNLLEQALPLAEQFHEAHNELSHWLDEAENESQMLMAGTALNPIQIKRQQDIINNLNKAIAEYKPVLDRMNKAGHALTNIVQEPDAKQVKRMMDNINERYNNLKTDVRKQQAVLDAALQETSQFTDRLDGLLKALASTLDQLRNAEPISSHPERIQEQIYENNQIIDDLSTKRPAYENISEIARDIINKARGSDDPAVRDIQNKLNKLNDYWTQCNNLSGARKSALDEALRVANIFWRNLLEAMKTLKELERTLNSEEQPAVEPNAISRQQERMKEIRREIESIRPKVNECKSSGADLMKLCGDNEKYEVKKNIDELDTLWNNVNNLANKRDKDLKDAMEKAKKFYDALQHLLEFLDSSEETFANFGPIASDLGAVRTQINELNNFKKHVDSHLPAIEKFNRLGNEMLESVSSSQAKSIREPVNEVNHRWDDLQKAIANRQAEMENALLKLGQFEQSLNDFLEWMKKAERELDMIKPMFSDPQVLEVELAKFKVLANDIYAHQSTVDTLNSAGRMLIENERGTENARNTQSKLNNLNSRWQQLLDKTEQRKREIEELLKEATILNQELLDTINWINEMDHEVSASKPVGGLPETAKEQLARFMELYNEIEANRFKVDSLVEKGEGYLKKSKEAPTLTHNLKALKTKWENLLNKANEKKIKLEIALAEAIEFHNSLEAFMQWLTEAEKYLGGLQPVSRVLERITQQIEEHKHFQKEVNDHRETMLDLDKKGTHLKYFSQKQDVILIKNLLVNVQHRWEKILSKTAERARNLDYALRETKEFYDAWQEMMNWLDEMEKNFDTMSPISNNSEVIRQMIVKHREFQRQLGAKHAQYDNTLKMGKHLKEKAPKVDVSIIQGMIDELKNKWNSICNKSVDRQRKLEEALLFSGQFKDAIDALMDWLEKAKNQFLNNSSVYGDLDTVTALVEEHKIFQEEFRRREKNLQAVYRIADELIKSSAEQDDSLNIKAEIDALNERWKEVAQLSEERSVELEKAIVEAQKLHKAVHLLLEWLSDAEMKLRFSGPMPEDEDATREQISEHEVFLEEMDVQEKTKEGTVKIAQDIFGKCHPEAAPVIKHWITIIQARWEEVNSWAKQREARLQDHLKSLLDIMDSLEKLLAWLIGAEAALLAAETQALPDDNIELDRLIDEHVKFMEELAKKGVDVDKVVKTFAIKKQALATLKSKESARRGYQRSSTPIKVPSDYGFDVKHPKVKELIEKQSKANKLSQDRMKRLQDKLDYNNEVERVKNFDFDDWRRRFLAWTTNKKARVIDFYKRIDSNNDGKVTKAEFIDGFCASKFTTSRLEMVKAADVFDRNNDGYIDHKEYVDALRPDRDLPKTESEIIQDEVQKQVDKCTCSDKYKVLQVGECKYRFGESQKLRLVRILRSTVMVRVGGGWIQLDEFLHKYDPCRLRGRTNIELRETLSDMSDSKNKGIFNDDGTVSAIGPITKIKEKTERSIPMNASDNLRFHSTSDYSFSDQHDNSGAKSRPRSRLTISSNSRPGSRHSSQPPSRAGSDMSIESLDSFNRKVTTTRFTAKSTSNLGGSTKKLPNSRQGSMSNLRFK